MKDLFDADMEIHAYINQQKWRVQEKKLFDEALRDIKVQFGRKPTIREEGDRKMIMKRDSWGAKIR